MIADEDTQELIRLVFAWVEARPFGRPLASDVAAIPEHLQALITTVEPYRAQALADAQRFLALPKPIGLGLTATLSKPPSPTPFASWARAIHPLHLHFTWSETMSAGFTDSADEMIDRVAWEDGRWVIVQIWDAAQRSQAEVGLTQIRQFFASTGSVMR
jgi:hypothetical protein